jgi:metal-dependent HD superfamily phosphatase/phosphodiesterase
LNAVQQAFSEDRRLAILRFLAEDKGYSLNTSVLQDALCAIGHSVSRDEVETQAAWLCEQGLVEVGRVGPVNVVKLTGRGADVAEGRARVPGVKRPAPR